MKPRPLPNQLHPAPTGVVSGEAELNVGPESRLRYLRLVGRSAATRLGHRGMADRPPASTGPGAEPSESKELR